MSPTSGRLKLLALLVAVAIAAAACGTAQDDNGQGSGGGDDQPEGGGTELLVEAHDFRFEVEGATLPEPGQDVTVQLENEGEAPHTFSSEEVDLDVEADPGADGEGTFTVPDDGTVDFQCNIHPQMKLSLTSGEASSAGSGGDDSSEGSGDETEDESKGDDYDY